MPRLKNPRHEAYAQAHAQGLSATEAYRVTYGTNSKNANTLGPRLALSANVCKRVQEIQADAEHVTHLTIAEKRAIYAREGRDRRNRLTDRLKALSDDSVLAKHVQTSSGTAPAMNVTVNVVSLTEERRAQLMEKRRQATEWQIANRNKLTQATNGKHSNGSH